MFDVASSTGSSLLRVLANGYIGVSTTNPLALFDVNNKFTINASGNVSATGTLDVYGLATFNNGAHFSPQLTGCIFIIPQNYIDFTGNYDTATAGFTISNGGTTGLIFSTGNPTASEKMRLNSSGKFWYWHHYPRRSPHSLYHQHRHFLQRLYYLQRQLHATLKSKKQRGY